MRRSTSLPIRAITRMLATTYAESVISTPNIGCSASRCPMTKGMTYIVRPAIDPRYRSVMSAFICAGAIQLLVGPASFSSTEQMKVRSSTRATSDGSEAAWKEFGFLAGSSWVKVPAATRASVSSVHSSSEPVHHWMRSGVVSSATWETKSEMPWWVVGAVGRAWVSAVISDLSLSYVAVATALRSEWATGPSCDGVNVKCWCDRPASLSPDCAADVTGVRSPDILDRSRVSGPRHTLAVPAPQRPNRPGCGRAPGALRGGLRTGARVRTPISMAFARSAILVQSSSRLPRGVDAAPVAQRIEHLTTDQKVGVSNTSGRASSVRDREPAGGDDGGRAVVVHRDHGLPDPGEREVEAGDPDAVALLHRHRDAGDVAAGVADLELDGGGRERAAVASGEQEVEPAARCGRGDDAHPGGAGAAQGHRRERVLRRRAHRGGGRRGRGDLRRRAGHAQEGGDREHACDQAGLQAHRAAGQLVVPHPGAREGCGRQGRGDQAELDEQQHAVPGEEELFDRLEVAQRVEDAGQHQDDHGGQGEGGEPADGLLVDRAAEHHEDGEAADPDPGGQDVQRHDEQVERTGRDAVPGGGDRSR